MALEGVLKKMDSGLLTSTEPECNGAEGVYFWSGAFTKDQINLITDTYKALVAGVEPNGPVYETAFQRVTKTPHTQLGEPNDLNFISTAPGTYYRSWRTFVRTGGLLGSQFLSLVVDLIWKDLNLPIRMKPGFIL